MIISPRYVVKPHSELQKICLEYNEIDGLTLLLDGTVQFTERNEYRYHECLVVVPMLYTAARSVLVCGGGDGLAAARLLRFDSVENIVVCDYDKAVTDLATNNELLAGLNEASFSDPRVRVVNEDAWKFLKDNDACYDLIICDFPDPLNEELSDLYSREFYETVAARLNKGGLVCIQTIILPESRAIIRNTVARVFSHTDFYETSHLAVGWSGFTLASDEKLERKRACPSWTRYLDDRVIDSLFVIPKDEIVRTDLVNECDKHILARKSLLGLYYDSMTRPSLYNGDYRVIDLYGYIETFEAFIPLFLRYCRERQPLIVYLDRAYTERYLPLFDELGFTKKRSYRRMSYRFTDANNERLRDAWRMLDRGGVNSIECRSCLTSEDDELVSLFSEYLENYGHLFLDTPLTEDPMALYREHLLARNDKGKVVVFMIVEFTDQVHVDVLYGRGSSRENMLGLLLCLEYIERCFGPRLSFDAATENIIRFMLRLGADCEFWMDTYVSPA